MLTSYRSYLIALFVTTFLSACGGDGGGLLSVTSPSITGSAATGAPIVGGKVYVVDSLGNTPVGQNEATGTALATTDANGAYSLTASMLSGLKSPFMIRVSGEMVTDRGDKAPAVFHAVVIGSGAMVANITPLTEAHAALALGAQPVFAYGSSTALTALTASTLDTANTKLATALGDVADFSSRPNFVSDALDATPGTSVSSNARKHDATLDQLSVSVSNGKIILADRNQDDSTFAVGPRVVVNASTQQVSKPAGEISAKPTPIDSTRVQDFATRFTTQLAAGCVLDAEPTGPTLGNCTGVTNPANQIFHAQFKDKGMGGWRWMKAWLTDAFETTDLTGVQVSVISANLGSFLTDGGVRVYRVLLKFTKGSDVVVRPLLVVDDQTTVMAFGNQKEFFFYIAPRFNYKADANGLYPYYPKYELGLSMMVKHWYAGVNNVIFGAKITGPGLPVSRQNESAVRGLLGGTDVNRNLLTAGIEVFDRTSYGCSVFAIDPSVYVERNTTSWSQRGDMTAGNIRQNPISTTCNPLFDMLRYDSGRDIDSTGFTVPKKGDAYSVTLYLDVAKFAPNTSLAVPSGVGTARIVKNADGASRNVYPYTFIYNLPSDGFALPTSDFNPATFGFPGVSDATRTNLAQLNVTQDLSIRWARNKTTLADGAVFASFYAGRYMSAYDQYRTLDSGLSGVFTYDDGTSALANYNDYLTSTSANCGTAASTKYRNGSIYSVPLIKKTPSSGLPSYTLTTCAGASAERAAAAAADSSATYTVVYSSQRARKQYVSDRGRLVATSDTSQTLGFNDLISREVTNDLNFCSSYDGLIRSRQVYVQLADMNGRQLMEMREVWWDYPNKSAASYAAGDPNASVSDRPYQATDPLYLANTSTGKTSYAGERGFVHTAKYKSSNRTCVDKTVASW